jgi:hypothetical protein
MYACAGLENKNKNKEKIIKLENIFIVFFTFNLSAMF